MRPMSTFAKANLLISELYWDVSDEAGCLIMVCPLHGNFSECSHPVPHFRPQFYNDGEGRKCYVCDAITC